MPAPDASTPLRDTHGRDLSGLPALPERFRPERMLGRGSERSVVLARDTIEDRWVAVSVFDTRALCQADIERVRQVHALAGSGVHPHVLRIDYVSAVDGMLFMVSPFFANGDLRRRLDESGGRPMLLAEALRVASQVCRALESVHAAGISHRDVKPENILLDERGDAYLGDFGLAFQCAASGDSGVAGTPAYLAPDQIEHPPGGPASDLYSLGCVLYELTTGSPPFLGERASDVLRQHQAARPVPPIERNPALPLVLSDLILKLLEKRTSARPASAGDVRAALEGILHGAGFAAISDTHPPSADRERRRPRIELPLVGRERELGVLEAALSRARDSTPGVVLVSGEAGSGKSRLLSELRSRAETSGCCVLTGKGDESATASYRPFVDALLPLAGHLSDLDPVHAELLRDFLYRGPSVDPLESLTPRGPERKRLFAATLVILTALARSRPLVLLLEDLHAFHPASIELFEHFVRDLLARAGSRDLALLVVASTRRPDEPRLSSFLSMLKGDAPSESLELTPLDERDIFDLLAALGVNRRSSNRLVRRISSATGGNPLFVNEVVHRLREAGLLDPRADDSVEARDVDIELPVSVGRAIAERIERLDPGERERLELGALLGARFDLARLALVAETDEEQIVQELDHAVSEGLLIEDGWGYAFAHPLFHQGVRDRLAPREQQRLHFRIARRLLDVTASDSDAALIEIAHHLVRSGTLADPTEVARIAGRAGQRALARFAWHEAAELLEAAVAAVQRGAQLSESEIGELHRITGLAYYRLMDAKTCSRHYDAAIASFERAGDEIGAARALNDRAVAAVLGLASYGGLGDLEPLERALARLDPSQTALRAQILSTLAHCYWAAHQPARAERFGVETLELARQIPDDGLCAEVSVDLGIARLTSLRVEEALSTWQAGIAHARRAKDLLPMERCMARSALALLLTGRLDEATEAVRAAREIDLVLQQHGEMSIASGVLVAIATVRGEFEAAERHAADALDRVRRVGYAWGTLLCLPALACARALQNDVAGTSRAIRRLFEPGIGFDDASNFEPLLARCLEWIAHWYAGDTTGIDVREVEALVPELRGHAEIAAGTIACALVELADALQSPALAAPARELLERAEHRAVLFWCGWPFFLPRLRGVAASLAGSLEDAERHLDTSIEIADRIGAVIELARSRLDLARLLATRNSGRDRARARELVAACQPILAQQGPAALAERAHRLAAFLARSGRVTADNEGGKPCPLHLR